MIEQSTNSKNLLVYETVAGSRLYGTVVDDSKSDYDSISAFVPGDLTKLFSVSGDWRSSACRKDGSSDSSSYDIRYFVHLACKGDSRILESLNAPPVRLTGPLEDWKAIQENILLSQEIVVCPTFAYLQSERKSAFGETVGKLGERRKSELAKLGFSPKNAHHALRIGGQGIHALLTQEYSPYPIVHGPVLRGVVPSVPDDWLSFLIDVKSGSVPAEEWLPLLDAILLFLDEYHPSGGGKRLPWRVDKDSALPIIHCATANIMLHTAPAITRKSDVFEIYTGILQSQEKQPGSCGTDRGDLSCRCETAWQGIEVCK